MLALTSTFLFLAGWGFEVGFFQVFGVNTTMFDLPFREYAIAAIFPLYRTESLTLLLAFAFTVGTFWFLKSYSGGQLREIQSKPSSLKLWSRLQKPFVITVIAAGIVFAAFNFLFLTVNVTGRIGASEAREYLQSAEHVHLTFKTEVRKLIGQYEADLLSANDQNKLRFCFESKDLVIVFVNAPLSQSKFGKTYLIERADLASVSVGINPADSAQH